MTHKQRLLKLSRTHVAFTQLLTEAIKLDYHLGIDACTDMITRLDYMIALELKAYR